MSVHQVGVSRGLSAGREEGEEALLSTAVNTGDVGVSAALSRSGSGGRHIRRGQH